MADLPKVQKAIQIQGPGEAKLVADAPVPRLRDDYILVRPKAVALNPTDWKHIEHLPSKGAIVGCDYAGEVVAVGPQVTLPFKPGDRVAGMVHGANLSNHEDGCFAEIIAAKGDVQMRIPANLSDEEAATLGVGVSTVGQALYQSLGLPLPTQPTADKTPVLIYGGSTATGTLAIQYAKLSGATVVATSSPRHHALLRSLGADHVFDYRDPGCAAAIRAATGGKLALALDCVSDEGTATICAEAIGPAGGKYSSLVPVAKLPRDDVENTFTVAYTIFGEPFNLGPRGDVPAKPEDFEFAKVFWALSARLLAEGKIKVHPPQVREGGLAGILDGVKDLKENKVSGVKLVYKV